MEQNKFEKNIQQKLDGLKIQPSESVWQHVEKNIEKADHRKRRLLILFFLALFLFTGGYFLLNSEKNNHSQSPEFATKSGAQSTIKNDSSSIQPLIFEKNDANKVTVKDDDSLLNSKATVVKNGEPHNRKSRKTVFFKEEKSEIIAKDVTVQENKNQLDEKSEKLQSGFPQAESDLKESDKSVSQQESINSLQKMNDSDSAEKPADLEKNLENTSEVAAASKKTSKASHSKKWNFGLTVSGGKSLVGKELLGLNNNYSYSDYNSIPNSGTGSGPGSPLFYSPSAIRNSLAFIAGVFVEKNISANHKISVGINYKYFSTMNKVGKEIISPQSALSYYTSPDASTTKDHRNNFDYLELPVLLKLKLGSGNSFPLYWQGGVSISQLISSSALQYKSSSGIYYIDNSLLNKTQFDFNTGIVATFFSKQKIPLTVGPYLSYGSSKISDKGLYKNKHFSFIGIRTEILLKK